MKWLNCWRDFLIIVILLGLILILDVDSFLFAVLLVISCLVIIIFFILEGQGPVILAP